MWCYPYILGCRVDSFQCMKRAWRKNQLAQVLRDALLPAWWISFCIEASLRAAACPVTVSLEVCSGIGNLSKNIASMNGRAATFEINDSWKGDLLRVSGVKLLLVKLLCICQNGLLWLGVPCSSWITISRGYTQRALWRISGPQQCSEGLKH